MSFQNLIDKIYYDVIITDFNNESVSPQPIHYNQSRSIPYLYEPDKYTLSVVRWTISDASTIPIWRCSIKEGSTSAVDSIFSISMKYNNQVFQAYLQYESQNTTLKTPLPPSQIYNGYQDNSTLFYDVYNYQYVIYLFNNLLETVFNGLQTLVSPLPTSNIPFFSFDTTTNIVIFNCDSAGFGSENLIQVFFNPATANLFYTFPYLLINQNSTMGLNYQLQINVFSNANLIVLPLIPSNIVPYNAFQIFQEYTTVSSWSPVLSICICSNTIPVAPNQISSLLTIGRNQVNPSGNNAQSNQVITDYSSDTGLYRGYIYYVPSAEYRRLTLMSSSSSLTNLDLSFFFRDRLGILNPLLLPSGASATVKLLFELI